MKELARIINISTVTVQSEGENAFLILDPKNSLKNRGVIKIWSSGFKNAWSFNTSCWNCDGFYFIKKGRESTEDAFIKANVHTVIGIAGGKVGTVIGTCVASKFAHSETTGIVGAL